MICVVDDDERQYLQGSCNWLDKQKADHTLFVKLMKNIERNGNPSSLLASDSTVNSKYLIDNLAATIGHMAYAFVYFLLFAIYLVITG